MINNIYKKNRKHFSRGFTLIETIVAIAILMIAIATPISLSQKSLTTADLSKDQMTATFLAQDAMESIKNIRDQVKMNNVSSTSLEWLDPFVTKNCVCLTTATCDLTNPSSIRCDIDSTTGDLTKGIYNSADNRFALWSETDGTPNFNFLNYNLNVPSRANNTASKFSRYINIQKPAIPGGNDDEGLAKVRVTWTSAQGPQYIEIKNFIYNY